MVELKTLKDIREQGIKDICKNIKAEPDDLCSFGALGLMSVRALVTTFLSDGLKQEAIKHIRRLKEEMVMERKETQEIVDNKRQHRTIEFNSQFTNIDKIGWIQDFFNITKEDLK